jgi:hypothetical protein
MSGRWTFGKIYILTNSVDEHTYIGSTCCSLHERWIGHVNQGKRNHLQNNRLYKHLNDIGFDNVSITLIENYPCHSQIQLELRENEWIRELKSTLNSVLPSNGSRQYCKVPTITRDAVNKVKTLLYRLKQTRYIEDSNESDDERSTLDTIEYANLIAPTMDIKTATSLLNNDELRKYFKNQCWVFHMESTSNLKDYFDTINTDTTAWLRSLPKSIKSKVAFHKYKAPVYFLLEHPNVIALLSQDYCSILLNNIKQAFKDSINDIINERTSTNTVTVGETESTYTEAKPQSACNNVNKLDHIVDTEDISTNTNNYDEILLEDKTLKKEFLALQREYQKLQFEYDCVKMELAMTDAQLTRVWDLLDKIVSK